MVLWLQVTYPKLFGGAWPTSPDPSDFHEGVDLDGGARRLETTMKELGARTDFRYVEGRNHFDLYPVGDDPQGLYKAIAWQMYALARPGSKPPPSASAPPPPAPAR